MRRSNLRFFAALAAFVALCLAVHLFGFHIVRVEGESMSPTLASGELALCTRFDYRLGEPARGDVVECRFSGRDGAYVKRLIGLPGEAVEIRGGRTYIDGAPLSEPYATGPMEDYSVALGSDEYLVLGDNRSESYDSRAADMGPIGRSDFLGRVRCALRPFRNIE